MPKSWGLWALQHFFITKEQIYAERDAFRDYWLSVPGQKGVKVDWEATWRNWLRNSRKGYRPQHAAPEAELQLPAVEDEAAAEWEIARRMMEGEDA